MSDAGIIAATHASLEQQVAAGRFRRHLHYRLNALYLRLPPWRERDDDADVLAAHCWPRISLMPSRRGCTGRPSAGARTPCRRWPGHVRELDNVALRDYVCADAAVIGLAELVAADEAAAYVGASFSRCPVIGEVQVHGVALAEDSIFAGPLRVRRRQQGCVRFCYQLHLKPVALVLTLAAVAMWLNKGWTERVRKRGR